MRHESLLDRRADGGASERDHLLQAARKGNEDAQAALRGPEPPEDMFYLVGWAEALYGRSGVSMEGLAPLSYSTIEAWARLMGVYPDPLEVQALITLDHVMRHPDRGTVPDEVPEAVNTPWPEKK